MDIGYSTELKKEVSVRDYLSLLGINPERQINIGDMDDTLLTFIRHDICCPSYGVSGASVLNINEVSDRLLSEQALKREIIEQVAYLKKESLYWNGSPSTPANRLD